MMDDQRPVPDLEGDESLEPERLPFEDCSPAARLWVYDQIWRQIARHGYDEAAIVAGLVARCEPTTRALLSGAPHDPVIGEVVKTCQIAGLEPVIRDYLADDPLEGA